VTFKTILVGLGKMGYGYDTDISNDKTILSHYKAIKINPNLDLVGIIESNLDVINRLSGKINTPIKKNLNQFKSIENIDLIVIATPPETHLSIIKSVLHLNPRAIILEKPVAQDLDSAIKILDLINKTEIEVFVNYQRNYSPIIRSLAAVILEELAGGPFVFTSWFTNNWTNSCSHLLALYLDLLGESFNHIEFISTISDQLIWKSKTCSAQFINIQNFAGTFFGFELICKDRVIRYDSHLNSIKIQQLGHSEFYLNELVIKEAEQNLKANEEFLLSEVYLQIVKFLKGEEYFSFSLEKGVSINRLLHENLRV
jgi:hypothetical protein